MKIQMTCPHPIILPQDMLLELERFHSILATVVTDIVERWWKDEKAALHLRMPLEKQEGELLKVYISITISLPRKAGVYFWC